MEIKILQVFLGADGLPYKDQERTVHFPIVGSGFQGASNTTKIRFYYDELVEQDDTETAWVACAKLPNGKIGSKVLETDYDSTLGEHYALLELDSFYFQYKGDVYISLQGYQGGVQVDYDEETELYTIYGTPTIAATGSIKLSVNYATQFVGSGETSNVNFQRILADLGTKLGIRATSVFVEELPTVGNPDTFYVIHNDLSDPNKANIYIWNSATEHYIWVGDNTLDLGDYYTREQGEQFESGIDNRVTSVENELSSVASGSPKGVYDTLAALQAAYPTGADGIYVVAADGHWYYWNGSVWADGGLYQAALGSDTSFSAESSNPLENSVLSKQIAKTTLLFEIGAYAADGSKNHDGTCICLVSPYFSKGNEYIYNGMKGDGWRFNVGKAHLVNGALVMDSWTTRANWGRVYLEKDVWYIFSFAKTPQTSMTSTDIRNASENIYIVNKTSEDEQSLIDIMNNPLSVTFDGTENWQVSGSVANGLYNFYTFDKKLFPKRNPTVGTVPNAMLTNDRYLTNGVAMTHEYLSRTDTPFCSFGFVYSDNSFWIRTNKVNNVDALKAYLQSNPMTVYYEANDEIAQKKERYNQEPKAVIFDTDWWTDVDDAMAIRLLLWAEREGMIDILGLSVNAVNDNTAKSLSRFLDYEGRGGLPFMVTNTPTDFGGTPSYFQTIIDNWGWGRYSSNSDVPYRDAKTYYKNCLESLPENQKATIICVGYLNNISEFLSATVADDGFDGIDLFSKKVEKIFIMGGNYPSGSENNFNRSALARSSAYNVVTNIPSNVPVVFLGFEVGQPVLCGGTIKDTLGTDDLIYKCLLAHGGQSEANNGRSAWDPMTVLLAVFDESLYDDWVAGYKLARGTNVVDPSTGANTFTTNTTGHHYYVLKKYPNNWYQYQINKILEKIGWKMRKLGKLQYN